MATVTFDGVFIQYPGAEKPSVSDLNLEIADGEFLVLVGPSGCGKSTVLRALAGLQDTTGGRILIGDRDVTGQEPRDRDIAMVFQNYALYPHLSVRKNMSFALKLAKEDPAVITERVEEAARLLHLEPYLDRKPKELSGGQRQRVAMGRAIVRHPQVFLMDEPLSNLDAKLRVSTRAEVSQLQQRLGTTTVYVTHDQTEAMTMGDRVVVLTDGVLQQVAAPRELYAHPANAFVAGFIGSPAMNLPQATVTATGVELAGHKISVDTAQISDHSEVILGIRPEELVFAAPGEGVPGRVSIVEELGADCFAYVEVDGLEQPLVIRADWRTPPQRDTAVHLGFPAEQLYFFDAESGDALPRPA